MDLSASKTGNPAFPFEGHSKLVAQQAPRFRSKIKAKTSSQLVSAQVKRTIEPDWVLPKEQPWFVSNDHTHHELVSDYKDLSY